MSDEIIPVPRELIALENACRSLAEIRDVDTVKDMRDTAQRMIHWAKRHGYEMSVVNLAAEAKVRTERRMGELLKEMPNSKTGPAPRVKSHDTTQPPTLAEVGIARDDSMKWQRIATVPEVAFEAKIEEVKQDGKALTTSMMLQLFNELNKPEAINTDQFDFSKEAKDIERWLIGRRSKWPADQRPAFKQFVEGILELAGDEHDARGFGVDCPDAGTNSHA